MRHLPAGQGDAGWHRCQPLAAAHCGIPCGVAYPVQLKSQNSGIPSGVVDTQAQHVYAPSLQQTTDISGLGDLEEAAKLLLPRGSRVIAGSVLQVPLPPRQTALGPVELPPKNYYRCVGNEAPGACGGAGRGGNGRSSTEPGAGGGGLLVIRLDCTVTTT